MKAKAILTIPLRLDKKFSIASIVGNGVWQEESTKADEDEIRKLGLLSYAHALGKCGAANESNDIRIYALKKDPTSMIGVEPNSIDVNGKSIFFTFKTSGETKKPTPFWGDTKVVYSSPSRLVLITLPVYLIGIKERKDEGSHTDNLSSVNGNSGLTEKDYYSAFKFFNDSIGYGKTKSDENKDAMAISGENSINKNLRTICKELLGSLYDHTTSLYTKSLISFICVQYPTSKDLDETQEAEKVKLCAQKLAWCEDREGFVADPQMTPSLKILANKEHGDVYASSSTFGTAFVSNYNWYDFPKSNQYFWIYLRLIILKYSLHCLLDDINMIIGQENLTVLRERYQKVYRLKAQFFYSEISDQYDTSRLYHLFYDGFKIKELDEEVEEKLKALDEIISIKKDEEEEKTRKESLRNDKKNSNIQIFITALVLVLTITSALNDFFDILEDSSKMIPGIISLAAVAIVMIIFKDRLKEVFDKKSR